MKVAIIGTGISGLGVASILSPHHDVTVFEKNSYIGGHTRTLSVQEKDKVVDVDTGFIVYNEKNYPILSALFKYLEVPTVKSDMSFGVSINNGWLEYATQSIGNIFAQKRNLMRPAFLLFLRDIFRFNKKAKSYLLTQQQHTLGHCLSKFQVGRWFQEYYLLAMGGAIWSAPLSCMLDFPAMSFFQFFDNHGLLAVSDQPQWYTIQGGAKTYVEKLIAPFEDKIKINCPISSVRRIDNGVELATEGGTKAVFDQVVMAGHADESLSMLQNPSVNETQILSAFPYQKNNLILHSDLSFMPKRKKAWASWVYLAETKQDAETEVSLTYWMNNLQPLNTSRPYLVTLNPTRQPNPDFVYNRHEFSHPLFNQNAIQAQSHMDTIQGVDKIWYVGAWQRHGFHEDGIWSAVKVANKMGIKPTWLQK